MAKTKYVYFFGGNKAEGNMSLKNLLGGKGAGLADMVNRGIPVPPGFTITTDVCTLFYKSGMKLPAGLKEQVLENLKKTEKDMGAKFGDAAESASFFCPFRRTGQYARYDGHSPQSRSQREDRGRPRPTVRERVVCL